jgi:hypothetical protein
MMTFRKSPGFLHFLRSKRAKKLHFERRILWREWPACLWMRGSDIGSREENDETTPLPKEGGQQPCRITENTRITLYARAISESGIKKKGTVRGMEKKASFDMGPPSSQCLCRYSCGRRGLERKQIDGYIHG